MAEPEAVILVHGLWVHGAVLSLLRRRVARYGYRALCYSYPSMRCTLTQNAEDLARYCARATAPKVHFIGHSLGGLVAVESLESHRDVDARSVVLLGTPARGSFAARRLAQLGWGEWFLGATQPLWPEGRVTRWTRPEPLGVIAGTMPVGLGRLFGALPGPNDGVVRVSPPNGPVMTQRLPSPATETISITRFASFT